MLATMNVNHKRPLWTPTHCLDLIRSNYCYVSFIAKGQSWNHEGGIYVGYVMLCLRGVPTRQKGYSPIGRLKEKKKRN